MRQPKFRGFSKETNSWVYGFGWFETDYTDDYLEELKQEKQDAVLFRDSSPVICTIASMGQYTGLKDINGREIYESDILKFEHKEGYAHEWQVVSIDKWCWGTREYAFYEMIERKYVFEVIGNVYENPELLNE